MIFGMVFGTVWYGVVCASHQYRVFLVVEKFRDEFVRDAKPCLSRYVCTTVPCTRAFAAAPKGLKCLPDRSMHHSWPFRRFLVFVPFGLAAAPFDRNTPSPSMFFYPVLPSSPFVFGCKHRSTTTRRSPPSSRRCARSTAWSTST